MAVYALKMTAQRRSANRSRLLHAGVIGLLGVAATGPIAYPIWLAWATRGRSDPKPPEPDAWPDVTALVCAYREREVIAAKVDDLRTNGYPGRLRVLVVADDRQTAAAARATEAEVISPGTRLGKAGAINRGVAATRDDILVLSDANAFLVPGSIAALVRWLSDPRVGAVAGDKQVTGGTQGHYWRFEAWLKRREWRRGSTIGLVGELAAVRRSLFRPLPTDLAVDDMWLGLDILEQGARIAYEPEAAAVEPPSPTWSEEWERRTRVVCGTLDVLWRRRTMLRPGGSTVWPELWGHRLVRSSLGPVAHALLLAIALRESGRGSLARAFVLLHAVGALAAARELRGAKLRGVERLVFQVLFLQAVALGGLRRFLAGDRPALWHKGERGPAR